MAAAYGMTNNKQSRCL